MPMRPMKNTTLIELDVPDFEKAEAFYKKLGFKVVWKRRPSGFKGYLVMRNENNILCFWPGNNYITRHPYFSNFSAKTKRGFGVEIIIMVKNIEKTYAATKKFAKVVEKLKLEPWGLWDFRVEDPFGYYLRITTPHNILDRKANAVP